MKKQGVFVQVPGLPGAGYVWKRRLVLVTNDEWHDIQQWKIKGYTSKSSMVLARYPHRVYHRSTR